MKFGPFIASLFLATMIMFSSLRISLNYAYYYFDPVGFIEKLCENKDKPELQCNGRCHLKMVTEQSTKNDKTPFPEIELKEVLLFIGNQEKFRVSEFQSVARPNIPYINLYAFAAAERIDHPPQV